MLLAFQGSVCVVNAASNRDIEVFAAGMLQVLHIYLCETVLQYFW